MPAFPLPNQPDSNQSVSTLQVLSLNRIADEPRTSIFEEAYFDPIIVKDELRKAWQDIHSGASADPLPRDFYAVCALILALQFFETIESSRKGGLSSQEGAFARRELDVALIIGTPLLRPELLEAVELLAPSCDDHSDSSEFDALPRHLVSDLPILSRNPVPRLESMSMVAFSKSRAPFVLRGAIGHWPAFSGPHRWNSRAYLHKLLGHRTLPVEVGTTYLNEEWTVSLMLGSDYLANHLERSNLDQMAYLAQARLFDQIPALKDDILIPDLALTRTDEDEVHINAWLGPADTITPCHHDPYDNFLCQVVGSKYIRLYAPGEHDRMYPNPDPILSNASLLDVANPDWNLFPLHKEAKYHDCILEEGEILFIPHGWWHYVRSLETSFSVSFWWPPDSSQD